MEAKKSIRRRGEQARKPANVYRLEENREKHESGQMPTKREVRKKAESP